MHIDTKDTERFWRTAERHSSGCWLWPIVRAGKHGYGSFSLKGRYYPAHRVAYLLHNGAIPDGLFVLHHCDVRNCVNPAHLYAGSNQENVDDRVRRGREGDRRGTKNGRAKLNEDGVREIRRRGASGESYKAIGRAFGISNVMVRNVCDRRNWRHVE